MTDEKRLPFMKMYWTDWRSDPALKMCSLAARGLWADMLGLMHEAEPYGHLLVKGRPLNAKQLGSLVGATERKVRDLLEELQQNDVFSVNAEGVIFSRRMIRDHERSARSKEAGALGGNPKIARGTVDKANRINRFNRHASPGKTRRIFERSGGKCVWCGITLQTTTAGPDFFQVDHVVAIKDGGTNDEQNLVAACAKCNHDRAKVESANRQTSAENMQTSTNPSTNPKTNPNSNPSTNTQSPESRVQSSSKGDDDPRPKANPTSDLERLAGILKLDHSAFHRHPKFARFPAYMADWITDGCDPALDIWPTITKLAKRTSSITSPAFFDTAIREARDLRLASKPLDRNLWQKRLEGFVKRGNWDLAEWGPKPNEAGCKAPADLVAKIVNGAGTQEANH